MAFNIDQGPMYLMCKCLPLRNLLHQDDAWLHSGFLTLWVPSSNCCSLHRAWRPVWETRRRAGRPL